MDQIIITLGHGLGLQNTIGWFLPIFIGTINVLPSLLTLFYYADKSAEFNKQRTIREHSQSNYNFIVGRLKVICMCRVFVTLEILKPTA